MMQTFPFTESDDFLIIQISFSDNKSLQYVNNSECHCVIKFGGTRINTGQ